MSHIYNKKAWEKFDGSLKGMYQFRILKPKFSTQRRFTCPRRTEGRDNGQRQETEEKGGEEGNQAKGEGLFVIVGQRTAFAWRGDRLNK